MSQTWFCLLDHENILFLKNSGTLLRSNCAKITLGTERRTLVLSIHKGAERKKLCKVDVQLEDVALKKKPIEETR